jgi:hypothetical protein
MIQSDKGRGLRCHGTFWRGSQSMLDSPRFEQACSHRGAFHCGYFLVDAIY